MKLARYTAHNVKRISDIDWDLQGDHLFVVGGANKQGKSSALEGLLWTLAGRRDIEFPEKILREGEDEAETVAYLTPGIGDAFPELEVRLKFKRSTKTGKIAETLTVTGPSGETYKKPRDILSSLYKTRALDPNEFDRADEKEQARILAELVGIDVAAAETERARLYNERRDANRDASKAEAEAAALPTFADVPEREISIAGLQEERREREQENRERENILRTMEAAQRQAAECDRHNATLRDEIAELERRIEHRKAQMQKNHEMASEYVDHAAELERKAESMTIQSLEDIDQEIREAVDTNQKIQANYRAAAAKNHAKKVAGIAEGLDARLTEHDRKFRASLEGAKWPVPGLSIEDGRVTFEGLPYKQRSRAERILLSFEIVAALNPSLRLFVCEDGSDLDAESLSLLSDRLAASDFQAIVEVVTRTAADEELCSVVIEDGKAKDWAE